LDILFLAARNGLYTPFRSISLKIVQWAFIIILTPICLLGVNWPSSPPTITSNTDTSAIEKEVLIPTTVTTLDNARLISVFDPWTKPLPTEPAWLKTWSPAKFGPNKGTVYHEFRNNQNYFYYRPYPYAGGDDQFIWPGIVRRNNGTLEDHNFTFELNIADPADVPIIRVLEIGAEESTTLTSGAGANTITFPENSVKIADFTLFDPDPTQEWDNLANASGFPKLSISNSDYILTETGVSQLETDSQENGWYFTYELSWSTAPLNFESLGPENFNLQITSTDTFPVHSVVYNLNLVLENVPEQPRAVFARKFPSEDNRVSKQTDGSDGTHIFSASLSENPSSLKFDFKVEAERLYNPSTNLFENGQYTLSHSLNLLQLANGIYVTHPKKAQRTPAVSAYKITYYQTYDSTTDTNHTNPLELDNDFVWTNGDEGQFSIEVLDADLFTFEGDWLEFTISAIDKNTNIVGNFLKVRAQIENDFQDPVTLNFPAELPLSFLENNDSSIYDFNATDPDSHPLMSYRSDNNDSQVPGAQIFYRLSGEDAELFRIDANGSLFFNESPNFEKPSDSTGDNLYEVSVQVHDEIDFTQATEPLALLILVEDANDPPVRANLFAPNSFTITTFEGQDWDFDTRRNLIDLSITDEDGDNILWEYTTSPDSKGQISLSNGRTEDGAPTTFIYTPDDLKFGSDEFSLSFSDGSSPALDINFTMVIQNDKDLPALGYAKFDGEPAYFEKLGGDFGYVPENVNAGQTEFFIEFNENSKPRFSIPFSDLLDEQNITS